VRLLTSIDRDGKQVLSGNRRDEVKVWRQAARSAPADGEAAKTTSSHP